MKALVLSGGGNYGAMQAGALEVLLRTGYRPDMVVGTSAGALNGIQLGASPTIDGVVRLQETWKQVGADQVGSLSLLRGLKQLLLQQSSLFPSQPLADFIQERFPPGIETFGELRSASGVSVFAVAASLREEGPRIFGEDPDDRLLDGAMASTALPPYFAPWDVGGEQFVDGGIYSNLALRVAVERGATRIFALWIRPPLPVLGEQGGILQMTSSAINLLTQSLSSAEIDWTKRAGVDLQVMELHPPGDIVFWDYDQAERLIEAGRKAGEQHLQGRHPVGDAGRWGKLQRRLRGLVGLTDRQRSTGHSGVAE